MPAVSDVCCRCIWYNSVSQIVVFVIFRNRNQRLAGRSLRTVLNPTEKYKLKVATASDSKNSPAMLNSVSVSSNNIFHFLRLGPLITRLPNPYENGFLF